jgi:acetyl esterase/lipase
VSAWKLWSDDVEAMRDEARATVDAGPPFGFGDREADPSLSRDERIRREREMMDSQIVRAPEAIERQIAGVRCRVFMPDGPARAIYLHFHGGGMVTGCADMMDIPNVMTARDHQVVVVSVDYRKAPEHPFPAGPDDGVAVARWLLEHGTDEFGASQLMIGGESAGGYMTAIVALRIRDELGAADRVLGCNMVFPVLDWGGSPSQRGMRPHDGWDVLSPEGIEFFTDCFVPGRTADERRTPDISPAFADLRGFPASFVSVGTCDHLLDDSLLFATRAAAAGVAIELFVAPELPHAFMIFDCGITKNWAQRTNEWIEEHLPAPA